MPQAAVMEECGTVSRYILAAVEETKTEVRQRSGGHRLGLSRRPSKPKPDLRLQYCCQTEESVDNRTCAVVTSPIHLESR